MVKIIGSLFIIVGFLLIIGIGIGTTLHVILSSISVPICLLFGTVFVTTGNIIRKKTNAQYKRCLITRHLSSIREIREE
ncbi:hypothetical protein [Bacillus gaemokensis]|uniref:Uncharacterized protein n=1 Tax=Bacillus gaemokensis TaxID=574375 RepID=A0A073KUT3_9BACI|nr:hypothetical protein [Bacillus gaemokensis]KEK26148.1 hypothetical protein BAGA_02625 [Bacillus gaemokensis]KYG38957.1 hypothetical protein AZF08_02680 [Bacillus gaemokensis]